MNETSFPNSIALNMKLEYPIDMKDDAESMANSHDWMDYIQEVRKVLKNKILHQGDQNCVWLQSQQIANVFLQGIKETCLTSFTGLLLITESQLDSTMHPPSSAIANPTSQRLHQEQDHVPRSPRVAEPPVYDNDSNYKTRAAAEPGAANNPIEQINKDTVSNKTNSSQNPSLSNTLSDPTQELNSSQAEKAESDNRSKGTTETVVMETQTTGDTITQPRPPPMPIHNPYRMQY
jgi:hypothetical protein